ncbi:MAG: orotidine-5'-phosphate decarboxylase [Candidatus Komeilibacteria bacterium]|nr:orotidine-5'-phosphate decarboxylase [Candidatus Komeilibacteria bacterium]
MSNRNFRELLQTKWDQGRFVCVGLDSELSKIPEAAQHHNDRMNTVFTFNTQIVATTHEVVGAYKLTSAFYEALGEAGWAALRQTINLIKHSVPGMPIILDAKRADIDNTNKGYVEMAFEYLGVDAITVHPYMGQKSLQPFLDRADKGIFVLCRTSNPGAGEFQDLVITPSWDDEMNWGLPSRSRGESEPTRMPLFQYLAYRVSRDWNEKGNCGLVVGATAPKELAKVREIVGDMPILIPGIGAQGGDLEATLKAGVDANGRGVIINSSRGIIFASSGADFAEAAGRETEKLHHAVTDILKSK